MAFRARSWPRELEFEKSRQSAGEESCPPGLGVFPGDGRLLHLCPTPTDLVVHYHYNHERRILGIFHTSRIRVVTADMPLSAADELISRFVAGDHEGLLRMCAP